ncbi:zinc ABC transporter substrate-binding protein [Viridibacillus sp. YIM B01967]|uniref:Zinc ABC transporter substrate-binding protein n=1 Tax=Viridibacillus soli TaxID=2798301 RepID=A0ABS1HAG9_9BACL|nr:zinc ABC transporter substrate-binding protein [Viridibacillus soli]MBK3496107.1 zinc ABC transporter substrate-binding protein [Viridibacillus soli]
MKKTIFIFLIAILTIFTAACGADDKLNQDKSKKDVLSIYTTVYPLTYFAERIGGEHVEVSSIYPPGSNEHTFEPTQKDMMNLADADLFFYIGLGLEGFVTNAQKTLKNENVDFVETAADVSEEKLDVSTSAVHDHDHEETEEDHDHAHGEIDPHVWLSPIISQDLALSIKDALVKTQPNNKDEFEKNYEALVTELQNLDKDFKEMADAAPSKTFFVSHSAFGYVAGTYGLAQISVAGLNSQDEPSQKELTKIVDQAKENHIHYILFEQNVSSKLAEVIQKEVGAEALTLHNLSVLTNEDIKNNETYFTLMHKNTETLKKALSKVK